MTADGLLDLVEDAIVRAIAGKDTARVAEQERASDTPVGPAQQFAATILWPPGAG